jgi:uncharacterized delta-60 repeat protein
MFRRGGPRRSLALVVALAACAVSTGASAGAASAAGIDTSYGEGGVVRLDSLVPAGYAALPRSEMSALAGTDGSALDISGLTACANFYESGPCQVPSAVRRITPAGALDGSYGEGGFLRLPPPGGFVPAAATDSRGRLLFAEADQGTVRVRRFTARGKLDAGFGESGVVSLAGFESAARSAAILMVPRGRLLLVVSESAERENLQTGARVTLVRLLPDGRVDRTYGTAGKAVLGVESSYGVTAYSTSTGAALVVAKNCCSSDSFTPVHRVTSAGKIDVRFNREERKAQVKALASYPETSVEAVVAGPDGTIELLGISSGFAPGPGFALRLTAKGRADTDFGDGGLVKLGAGVISAGPGSDGSTLAVLEAFPPGGQGQSRVERLLADGRPDQRFGGEAGIALPEPGAAEFAASAGGRALFAGTGDTECQGSCQSGPYLTRLIEPSGSAGAGKGGKH